MFSQLRGKRAKMTWGADVKRSGLRLPDGAGRIECRVLDPVGLPIRAEVALGDAGGRPVVRGSTDPYGLFTATMPPGDYKMAVTCEGFRPCRTGVRVAERSCTSVGEIQLDVAPAPPLPTPGHWDIDPAHTAIRFIARHIGLAEIHGRFNRFSGRLWVAEDVRDSQFEVAIEADSIDTGLRMRDDHLRSADFLDVAAYPYLHFAGDQFTHRGGTRWTVTGALELHGMTRTVQLETTYLGTGRGMEGESRAACHAATELHREDFTLNWQTMLARGIAVVGATIRIELDVQVVQAGPSPRPPAR